MILHAYVRAPATRLAPLSYLQAVTGAVLGYLVFADVPTLPVVVGLVLIVIAGVLVRQRRSRAIGAATGMR